MEAVVDGSESPVAVAEVKVETQNDMISRREFQKVLSESIDRKKQIEAYENKLKTFEEDKLKEGQKWEQLAKIKEQEADRHRKEKEELLGAIEYDRKWNEVSRLAQKHGLIDAALEDIRSLTLDEVVIERTSEGRINVLGAEEFIVGLKGKKPHWFGQARGAKVNADSPEVVTGSSMTYDDLVKFELKAKKSGAKSDWDLYQRALLAWKTRKT